MTAVLPVWQQRLQLLIQPLVTVVGPVVGLPQALVTTSESLAVFDNQFALNRTKPLSCSRLRRISIPFDGDRLHIDSFLAVIRSRKVVLSDSDWAFIVKNIRVAHGLEEREHADDPIEVPVVEFGSGPIHGQPPSDVLLADPDQVVGDLRDAVDNLAIVPVDVDATSAPAGALSVERRILKLRLQCILWDSNQ